ncbi:Abi family protein [Micromonospora tarensis]|uniref:Abi family protein n=1 Tax=Micromonospora tarensis TaxID=2806100 RepID=A0ABS1YQX5_9ACTN|nr:Abi family protein [Micromonospora tarensis]MBM0279829.1 Abi family protein [Micromonospora tarensis]
MVTFGAAELLTLERRWSPERLAPYRAACHGDLAAAVALYRWNAEISAALGTTIGHVEVLLRNALHEELTAWSLRRYGEPAWYLDPGGVLSDEGRRDVVKARSRATRDGRLETPGRVVAELNLGFWRFLLATRYDGSLWRGCLHRAVAGQRRRTVHAAVSRLHEARNRMAHHEPMFNRPVADLRQSAVEVAGWLCPVTRDWIDAGCRLLPLLADRPRAVLPQPRH